MAVADRLLTITTPRVERLHRRLMEGMLVKQPVWGLGLSVVDDPVLRDEPIVVRKARAAELVLTGMPVVINDDELIVGRLLPQHKGKEGRTNPEYALPEEKAQGALWGYAAGAHFGHSVPDYPTLLTRGLRGVMNDAHRRIVEINLEEENENAEEKQAFLRSVIICGEAVIAMARRHAEAAEKLADSARDPKRAAELRQIAANCRRVPEFPPETFWQALQSMWFIHLAIASTMGNPPCGRLDQYLYPFYQKDLTKKGFSAEKAQELIDCLWIKFNEKTFLVEDREEEAVDESAINKELDEKRRRGVGLSNPYERRVSRDLIDATNHWLQNIILGGQTPEGRDATNDLTYMCLNALEKMQLTNPVTSLRVHRNTPPELLRRAAEVMRAGGGMPAIFNDEVIVPALVKMGYPLEHALDYSNDGCWEITIPGRTQFRFCRLGLLKFLEWTLNRGRSLVDGLQESIDTGDPASFQTFEDLWAAYCQQMEAKVADQVRWVVDSYGAGARLIPEPLTSALIDGCIENAKDMTDGGARYPVFALIGDGASHAVDSLVAIRKAVFEARTLTMAELVEALQKDFDGQESLRQHLMHRLPKYGNDNQEADAMAARLVQAFSSCIARHAEPHSWIKFPCGIGTFSWYIAIGEGIGATPDGRHSQAPVGSNFSPSAGADIAGPTAVLRSYGSADLTLAPAGAPLDMQLQLSPFQEEDGLRRLVSLLQTFSEVGGSILSITLADVETLKAAQREPEKYRSLRIRMGGWSAYFVTLSKEQQDYHIARVMKGEA